MTKKAKKPISAIRRIRFHGHLLKRVSLKPRYWGVAGLFIFASIGAYLVFFTHGASTGWYSGAACSGVANGAFEQWRGDKVTIAGTWNNSMNPGENYTVDQPFFKGEYGAWSQNLDDAIGAFTSGGSWSAAAAGSYDSTWHAALATIDQNWGSKKTVFIRFAHEFNGDWYPWSVRPSDNSNYIASFRKFYNMVQTDLVSKGRNAKVVWPVNSGSHNMDVTLNWPGDQYVDVIGVDYYDWGVGSSQASWDSYSNQTSNGPYGIYAWQTFAASHGKPISFPEWGTHDSDNPFYIQKMNEFMRANAGTGPGQVWYDIYYNCESDSPYFMIYSPVVRQNASATYNSLQWGGDGNPGTPASGGGTTPSPTPTPTPTPSPTPNGEVSASGNLLAGKSFTSSVADSTTESGHPTSYLTDGNGATRWISQPQSPVNLTTDMGAAYTLSKVSVKWAGDTIKNFSMQISGDGSNWTTFYTGQTTNVTPEYRDYTSFTATPTGRYIRIVGNDRWDASYGNSIWEVGAYGTAAGGGTTPTPTPTPPPPSSGEVSSTGNLLTGKVFGSSVGDSTTESGHPVAYITDGNGATRWISQPQSPVAATVDMGARYVLNKVSVKWAGNTIKNFNLQTSDNGSTWTTFYTGATTNVTPEYVDYTSFTTTPVGRYLRINGVDRWNASYGNSIWEAGAYGSSAVDTSAPSVVMTAPASGASVSGDVTVSGRASDNIGVTQVQLLVDGAVALTNGSDSASFTWNSKSVGDSNHTLALAAVDAAGNRSQTTPITVGVHNTTSVPAPTIRSFTATPNSVTVGGTSSLAWSTTNASSCSVNPGGPQNTTAASWMTAALTSVGSRTYTLDCQNSNGQHASATAAVTVSAAASPPSTPVFTASATTVKQGSSVVLSWSSNGATGCTLNPGNVSSGGTSSYVVNSLNQTTTYSLICSNTAGTASAPTLTVSVTTGAIVVSDPVIVSLTATPQNVGAGGSAVISWVSSNVVAGGCNLTPSPLVSTSANGSWMTPALTASASYTLTCVNSTGKIAVKSISVTVNNTPAPTAPASATPPVNTSDATQTKLKASNGSTVTNAAATDTAEGLTTLDPSNITNSSKEDSILRVEYYNGESLVQTVYSPPFALDTTKLKDGTYTITERTYFTDGSQSQQTKVIKIANAKPAVVQARKVIWKSAAFWVIMVFFIGLLIGGFWFMRRKLRGGSGSSYDSSLNPAAYDPFQEQPTYNTGTPSWQQGITTVEQPPVAPPPLPAPRPVIPLEEPVTPEWQKDLVPHAPKTDLDVPEPLDPYQPATIAALRRAEHNLERRDEVEIPHDPKKPDESDKKSKHDQDDEGTLIVPHEHATKASAKHKDG